MKPLEKNVGKTDRIVRFVLGLALFAAGALYLGSPLAYAAYFIGLILIATGALGTCGLYSILNFNTLEPGEGCKCREGEICTCAPTCKTCSPKSKAEMDAELREIPVKKEELAVDIPVEAEKEEKPFVPYTAPMASRALMEKEPEAARKPAPKFAPKAAPKAKKAPAKAKKPSAKKAKPAKKKKK